MTNKNADRLIRKLIEVQSRYPLPKIRPLGGKFDKPFTNKTSSAFVRGKP